MKGDIKRLLNLLDSYQKGNKEIDMATVFRESLIFFEDLKEVFKTGSDEDKKEAMKLMNELYTRLMDQTKALCERNGMSEEQLYAYCENPNNFEGEQWRLMEAAKKKLYNSGRAVTEAMQPKKLEPPPHLAPEKKSSEEKKEKKPPKPKRDTWMRS